MVTLKVKNKFTYEDYRNTPDDVRYELLDGELIVVPAPNMAHQGISTILLRLIDTLVYLRKLGKVFHAPTDVVFSDTDTVQPDLIFVSNERSHIITEDNIRGAPDLGYRNPFAFNSGQGQNLQAHPLRTTRRQGILDG